MRSFKLSSDPYDYPKKKSRAVAKLDNLRDEPQSYGQRDKIVKSMGLASYKTYLKTSMWQLIRDEVKARDKGLCRVCCDLGAEAHHFCYSLEVLMGRKNEKIIFVCSRCHRDLEFDGDNKRLLIDVQTRTLEALG